MTNVDVIFGSKVTESLAFEIMEILKPDNEIMYHDNKWWIRVPHTTVGTYVGATVEKANQRYLEEQYLKDILCELMDFGTTSIWANMSNYDLMEEIWNLEKYPCFDDEVVSIVEHETIVEYMRSYLLDKLGWELIDYDGLDNVITNVISIIYNSDDIDDIIIETGMTVYIPNEEKVLELFKRNLPEKVMKEIED